MPRGSRPKPRPRFASRRPDDIVVGAACVISCEHGGYAVPAAYVAIFAGMEARLASHRGWDPGALPLARQMARALGVPLHAATTTRLLVDLNRSVGHRQLFSDVTRALPPKERSLILVRHYRPHRDAVEAQVARLVDAGRRVIHVAVHSFTPVLDGVERRADVGWLYDPRRSSESAFVGTWMAACAGRMPELRLRRNYPYLGRNDGLTALLRKRHPDRTYAGIELEVNQRLVASGGGDWRALRAGLVASLEDALTAAVAR
jgi:predicted N-formylglutamate amidohydrolase